MSPGVGNLMKNCEIINIHGCGIFLEKTWNSSCPLVWELSQKSWNNSCTRVQEDWSKTSNIPVPVCGKFDEKDWNNSCPCVGINTKRWNNTCPRVCGISHEKRKIIYVPGCGIFWKFEHVLFNELIKIPTPGDINYFTLFHENSDYTNYFMILWWFSHPGTWIISRFSRKIPHRWTLIISRFFHQISHTREDELFYDIRQNSDTLNNKWIGGFFWQSWKKSVS